MASSKSEPVLALERYTEFAVISPFNSNSNATIWKATSRADGSSVAIKQLDRVAGSGQKWENRLRFELEAHATVSHRKCKNVCRTCFDGLELLSHTHVLQGNLIEIIPGDAHMFLVMELCDGKQLFDLVAASPKRRLAESFAAEITRQLVTGVCCIHDAGFIHRDLKPENILVSADAGGVRLKIVDFGAAKPLIEDESHELGRCALEASVSAKGTTVWNASPERSFGEAESSAADVWAVGCILFFLLTGSAPFASLAVDEPEEVVIDRVIDEEVRWPVDANFSPEARELVEWLLDKDVAERPTLTQVLSHKWLAQDVFNPFS